MYLTTAKPTEAVGQILLHNVPDFDGRKAFAKGHRLLAGDLPRLDALGVRSLQVAVLESGDIHEDEAARRIASAISGPQVVPTAPAAGRVNLLAEVDGVMIVDLDVLLGINMIDGLTVATLEAHTRVRPKQRVATVKVIPFAISTGAVREAEAIAGERVGIGLHTLPQRLVGVLLVGSLSTQPRLEHTLLPAIVTRIEGAGSKLLRVEAVESEQAAIASALGQLRYDGAELIIVAGETSIMDRDDVTPRAIVEAGGSLEHFGAPVEPGNQLLLAYLKDLAGHPLPVVGAPGCVRSRTINVVDLVLPRLLAGEYLTKRDIVMLGHGGLLG